MIEVRSQKSEAGKSSLFLTSDLLPLASIL